MNKNVRVMVAVVIAIGSILACTFGQKIPGTETALPYHPTETLTLAPPTATSTPSAVTVDDFFARCPAAQEVAQVNVDFHVTFEYDPTAPTLVCHEIDGSANLTALQKRAYQTIYVMHYLNFSQPLPWTNKQLYDWLVGAIKGIRFINGGGSGYSFCCEPANTIVIALNSNSIILQTDRWMLPDQNYGLMNTMILYVHEARHNEGYVHTCTSSNGDDNTVAEMGSWSVQYYLALWIAQYGDRAFLAVSGPDPNVYRERALQDSQTTRRVRFCKDPAPPIPTLIP